MKMQNYSLAKNNMKNIDGTEHLMNAVSAAVKSFVGVTRNAILKEAEQKAEEYVSSTLGLDDSSFSKQIVKDQFINAFTDKIKWAI